MSTFLTSFPLNIFSTQLQHYLHFYCYIKAPQSTGGNNLTWSKSLCMFTLSIFNQNVRFRTRSHLQRQSSLITLHLNKTNSNQTPKVPIAISPPKTCCPLFLSPDVVSYVCLCISLTLITVFNTIHTFDWLSSIITSCEWLTTFAIDLGVSYTVRLVTAGKFAAAENVKMS